MKNKMEEIFYQNQDKITGRFIVIDEIEGSIWAYLTYPYEERIDKDCFLGSRLQVKIDRFNFEEYKEKQLPPPMIKEFSTSKSWLPTLKNEDISIEWRNGNPIVAIKEVPFLFFVKEEERGFCKSISKNGMYGNKWNEIKYNEI